MAVDTVFFDLLRKNQLSFRLVEPVEINKLRNGSVYTASLGEALWVGEVRGWKSPHHVSQEVEALLDRLQSPGEFFEAYDVRINGPRDDPGGVLLQGYSPTIQSVGTDSKSISITGLPPGYSLTPGDQIGWRYGTNPERWALHRFYASGSANATGTTGHIEVNPHLRSTDIVGAPVALVRPRIKARLLSSRYGSGGPIFTEGPTIRFIQSLR